MGNCVNTFGHAADNNHIGLTQIFCDAVSHGCAILRTPSGAYDTDFVNMVIWQNAFHINPQRRIVNLFQQIRIGRVEIGIKGDFFFFQFDHPFIQHFRVSLG